MMSHLQLTLSVRSAVNPCGPGAARFRQISGPSGAPFCCDRFEPNSWEDPIDRRSPRFLSFNNCRPPPDQKRDPAKAAQVMVRGDQGYVDIPGAMGTGDFAVATINLGAGAQITAGAANIPVTLTINPSSGACLATLRPETSSRRLPPMQPRASAPRGSAFCRSRRRSCAQPARHQSCIRALYRCRRGAAG
jgi:hypothetical protein